MEALWSGFKTGLAQGWRGYFAPIRLSPWRCAIDSARAPGARWYTPATTWLNEIDRIVKGKK